MDFKKMTIMAIVLMILALSGYFAIAAKTSDGCGKTGDQACCCKAACKGCCK